MKTTFLRRLPGRLLAGFALALLLGSLSPLRAAPEDFPEPPELKPAVHFWIRVYTEIGTNAGFLHDDENLAVVYDTLQFGPDSSPHSREQQVEAARTRIVAALKRIAAAGDGPLSPEDQHIKDLWGTAGTPTRLIEAIDHVRFQLGQADRFRQGLLRSGQWQTHIEEVLANLGLPPELGVLPHVESSFNPAAYSKVGAAGLWQFMRSTGRRYMRIDAAVDDRMDPFRATEAAAQLLSYNHRLLGTWPLALTAYNHGAEGMRRAKEQLGTDDIVQILRNYHSPSFGFASRNFYVSFLAALAIDRNPQQYFGPIVRYPETKFQEIELPANVGIGALERAVGIDGVELRELNPALLASVWKGRRRVPRGYLLRLPLDGVHWTQGLLTQSLRRGAPPAPRIEVARAPVPKAAPAESATPAAEPAAPAAPAESAAPVATAQNTAAADSGAAAVLVAASSAPAAVAAVAAATGAEAADESADGAVSAEQARSESEVDARAVAQAVPRPEPVSKSQAEAAGPALGPSAPPVENTDPTDYSVSRDGSVVVAAGETLGHYARWLGVKPARLRQLNHLRRSQQVAQGRRMKLDFAHVSRARFEGRRREYHRQLQAAYFAAHRISGTEVYISRAGDSLWELTRRFDVPSWLLLQYNPDVRFDELRPQTQITVPQVKAL